MVRLRRADAGCQDRQPDCRARIAHRIAGMRVTLESRSSSDVDSTLPEHGQRFAWLFVSLGVAVALAASLWFIVPHLRAPFVYDDVSFALGGRAVATTGLPFGNQGYLLHLYWEQNQWAL